MKQKMKEFVEKHKKAITVVGVGAVLATSGLVGYKVGQKVMLSDLIKKANSDEALKTITDTYANVHNTYIRTLLPEDGVKFKELGKLAQDAIDFDASHLEDTVVGMFVMTNPMT